MRFHSHCDQEDQANNSSCFLERGMLKISVPAQRKKKKQKERIDRVYLDIQTIFQPSRTSRQTTIYLDRASQQSEFQNEATE
jgi:hypothetical protein